MNKFVMAAAMLASTIGSAQAATIVQFDTDAWLLGMDGFDSRLGRLDKVTLEINFSKARDYAILFTTRPTATVSYGYVTDGLAKISYFDRVGGNWSDLSFGVYGEGQGKINFSNPDERGLITVGLSGNATFDLNPANFIATGYNRIVFDPYDPFYYGGATDTHLVLDGGFSAVQVPGSCGGYRSGSDFCGSANMKLTYFYVPTSNPAVPEPGTWMMMILGFGAVGYAMRRKTVLRFV